MPSQVKLYKLLCEYRFKPSLLYYDHKNRIGDNLFRYYKHWRSDGMKIALSDFEKRTLLAIEHNRLVLEYDLPPSSRDFQEQFQRAYENFTDVIKIEEYKRLGIRSQSMIPLEFKFEELVGITQNKFFSNDQELWKIMGIDVHDYMFNVVTRLDGLDVHLICGPVKKDEIPRWFQPAKVETSPGEISEEIQFPDVAFFVDCDIYLNNPDLNVAKDFLAKRVQIATQMPEEIAKYLFEK